MPSAMSLGLETDHTTLAPKGPNDVWTANFKGQFRLGCSQECYPLSIMDSFSRFILCIDAKYGTHRQGVQESMQRVFNEHDIPEQIKSDNGSPFAGLGLATLSNLTVWLMSNGI